MSQVEFDTFTDVFSDDSGGSLESPGLRDYDNVQQTIEPDGLKVAISCRLCGRKHELTLEWHELYVIGSNKPGTVPIMPRDFRRSEQGTAYTQYNCTKCANPGITVHITPDEAARHINTAVQSGFVSPQQAQTWGQQVMQARGQAAR